ncbi:hypothetical protein LCGC14_0373040 [marine sediment metagenome]|uniref:Uncharacterized protein n=1 Tax=marine sediment metagenome TaxID=412755 RepID=A0A0F9TA77_9ZZZZ
MMKLDRLLIAALIIGLAIGPAMEALAEEPAPWGWEYVPTVITWYGEYVPLKKDEMESFKAKGAFSDREVPRLECEKHLKQFIKAWRSAHEDFHYIATCVEKPLTKPPEPEPEEK